MQVGLGNRSERRVKSMSPIELEMEDIFPELYNI